MADISKVTVNIDIGSGLVSLEDLTHEQLDEIWARCAAYDQLQAENKRLREALVKISFHNTDAGTKKHVAKQALQEEQEK